MDEESRPQRSGSPTPATKSALTVARGYDVASLPLHVAAWIEVDPDSGCWRYTRRHDRDGYGRIGDEGAHRVVWELLGDPIPAGRVLDHVKARGCIWNDCVWPAHLEPVTHRTNVLRGTSFAATNFRKEECDHGHPYDLVNTYHYRNRRDCRVCGRDRVKRYRHRQRSQAPGREAIGRAA